MPLKFENWDGVAAPAIPAGWTADTGLTTTSTFLGGITPISSPNALALLAIGNSTPRYATWGTADTASGNVAVSAYFNTDSVSDAWVIGLFLRCNVSAAIQASSTYYVWNLDAVNLNLRIRKNVGGTLTTLQTTNISSWTAQSWVQVTFTANGSLLTATVQRVSDGFWLNSSGVFQSSQATSNTVTDTAISGSGYTGLSIVARSDHIYTDNWQASAVAILGFGPLVPTEHIRAFRHVHWRGAMSPPDIPSSLSCHAFRRDRRLTQGWAHIPHTANRSPSNPPTFSTPLSGLRASSPRRLTPGSVRMERTTRPITPGLTPPGMRPKSPRVLRSGWAHVPHTAGRHPVGVDVSILPARGIKTTSPRRFNRGTTYYPQWTFSPIVFVAGTPICDVITKSPRRLRPGWAHVPHTARQNPANPPTFLTPLNAKPIRSPRRFFAGRVTILRGSKPSTPTMPLHGLQIRSQRPLTAGRVKASKATTQFLDTPLDGLRVKGRWRIQRGRVSFPQATPGPGTSGRPGQAMMIRSPRRLVSGKPIVAKSLARIQPYSTIQGLQVRTPRPWRPGRVSASKGIAPASTPGMILHWSPATSPRRLPKGWAHVPHTIGNSIVNSPSSKLPLTGLRISSPRRLRPGSVWQAILTPHALGGPPLRMTTASSPRRLRSGLVKPSSLLMPSTNRALRPTNLIRVTPVIRRGRSFSLRGLAVVPPQSRFAGISKPISLPVAPRLRRGKSTVQSTPRIPPPAAPQLTIREAVAARLNALAPLTAIVGARIYWDQPSQKAIYPCLTITVPSREWGHNLPGADGTSTAQFTFTAIGYNESDAIAIVKTIKTSLDGFQGFQSGIQFLRTFITDESDDAFQPPDGSDQWIYVCSVEYEIVHRVPTPTNVTQTDV